ncbi:C2H2 transcription factor [Histoplasma capsulatum var. duboisii H88]|uniref:C2H2 transcription factor n=1 Tax=Ajellomyces capsulatus (strain H88) TaxID=544711 RepID=F0U6G0_AJEC8|nr:C2H2 transcription factor [Histoplasma capsulatum var. duboisii H88]QSS51305.1 C2H2 transcription factor [Histoplasma capsulatum var. duboisii H88]
MSLHQNLTKLDIRGNKDASQWSQQTIGELRNIASQPFDSLQQQTVEPIINRTPDASRPPEQPAAGANSNGPTTPSQNKRRGWYNGPLPTSTPTGPLANPSPEDSSSSEGVATPSASAPEYHPAIVPSHGDIERHHSHIQTETPHNWQTCAPREPQSTNNNAYPVYPNPEPRHVFYSGSPNHPAGGMARLEALVAVATSEDKGTSKFI